MNQKLFLVTVEISHMNYKSGRILASSKKAAVMEYCKSIGLNVGNYRSYPDVCKVDNMDTGSDFYCYVNKLR